MATVPLVAGVAQKAPVTPSQAPYTTARTAASLWIRLAMRMRWVVLERWPEIWVVA